MAGVRRGHVHGIDIRIVGQSLVAGVPVRDAELVPERLRRSPRP
jgi:hypothetical protein